MALVLVKASGDVIWKPEFLFVETIQAEARMNDIIVICGGSSRVNEALRSRGYKPEFDNNGTRILRTSKEREIARRILEVDAIQLDSAIGYDNVWVIPPVLRVGPVYLHINADDLLIKLLELGGLGRIGHTMPRDFDRAIVFTLKDRVSAKEIKFKECPTQVRVVGL